MIVRTTYLKATDTQGERIKARTESGGTSIVGWDYALNQPDNHEAAAMVIAQAPVFLVKPRQRGYTWSTEPLNDGVLNTEES